MRNTSIKTKLIEALTDTPLVFYACKKVGLSRATFYRWRKDDINFRDKVNEVLDNGRAYVSELSEAGLIKAIRSGEQWAIKFWLQNNNPRYRSVPSLADGTRVLKVGQHCKACGHQKTGSTVYLADEDIERVDKIFGIKKMNDNSKIIKK